MRKIGKYIYGIIDFNTDFHLCASKSSSESSTTVEGCEVERVYTIPYRDVSAVVSDSEIVDYTSLPKDVVARYLIRHQRIIEKVMENLTIIPMRIGTFAYDAGEVSYILSKGCRLIKEIFDRISDKIEIDVAATWSDLNLILKEVGEEEEIKVFKESLLVNSGGVTVDDQMKVGVMVKKALDTKRERTALEIQKELKNISQDFRIHELMDDKMVANVAFLINKSDHKDFERIIEELNARFNEKLNFRCVGPLPPYSFYTLEVKKFSFEEIDWARKRLGLVKDFVAKGEIKKAHQALAFALHPDKNPNTPGIEREFDEVTKAYKTLWEYCQGEGCSFDEEEFKKNSILVRVKE